MCRWRDMAVIWDGSQDEPLRSFSESEDIGKVPPYILFEIQMIHVQLDYWKRIQIQYNSNEVLE